MYRRLFLFINHAAFAQINATKLNQKVVLHSLYKDFVFVHNKNTIETSPYMKT